MSFNMGLSENQRQEMAKAVTAVLADTYALYFKTHVYHWNVTGPRFHDLHALFELQVETDVPHPCDSRGVFHQSRVARPKGSQTPTANAIGTSAEEGLLERQGWCGFPRIGKPNQHIGCSGQARMAARCALARNLGQHTLVLNQGDV